jgi:hypothetical protein
MSEKQVKPLAFQTKLLITEFLLFYAEILFQLSIIKIYVDPF